MKKESQQKVLIIKTGYSEVLEDNSDSVKPSFGDILRITPLLHLYKDDYVIWLTDKAAFPLLKGNPYINELLSLNFENAMKLLDIDDFDTIINLEKNHDICRLVNQIGGAWRRYGFRLDKKTQTAQAYDRAFEVLSVSADLDSEKQNKKTVQELLFEMVGEKWKGEEYVLGYKPTTKEKYDVGLNTKVGAKWPIKAWLDEYWNELRKMLIEDNFKVTKQDEQSPEILTNLYKYMDWINSCKIIISNDSLGMHLGIALKKKVIGLFGPTAHKEVYFYNRGKAILLEPSPDCMPCFKSVCERGRNCLENIKPQRVYEEIKNLLKSSIDLSPIKQD